MLAYVYIRSISKEGFMRSFFLGSKSRVAPLKAISSAGLKLCKALLLAQFVSSVLSSLKLLKSLCSGYSQASKNGKLLLSIA